MDLTPSSLAKRFAKIILSEWVGDAKPLHESAFDISFLDDVERAVRHHAIDCEILAAEIPLVIAVPEALEGATKARCEAEKSFGLSPSMLRIIPEAEVPAGRSEGDDFRIDLSQPPRLGGGGLTLARLGRDGVLGELEKAGVEWLLFGHVRNSGCRFTAPLIRWIDRQGDEGIVECADRDSTAGSMVYLGTRPEEQGVICLDSRRIRGERFSAFRAEAKLMATGSFWARIKAVRSLLSRDSPGDLSDRVTEGSGRPEILTFVDGSMFMVLPLWELLNSLHLSGLRIGPDRYRT